MLQANSHPVTVWERHNNILRITVLELNIKHQYSIEQKRIASGTFLRCAFVFHECPFSVDVGVYTASSVTQGAGWRSCQWWIRVWWECSIFRLRLHSTCTMGSLNMFSVRKEYFWILFFYAALTGEYLKTWHFISSNRISWLVIYFILSLGAG